MAFGLQRCLGYGGQRCTQLVSNARRCTAHGRQYEADQTRAKRAVRPRVAAAEDQARAAVVRTWRAQHGDLCPGWGRPAHYATDLTCDHVQPYALTRSEAGERAVLCTSCNSAKGARVSL